MDPMQAGAPAPAPSQPSAGGPKIPKSVIIAGAVVVGLGLLGLIGSYVAGRVVSFGVRKAIEAETGVKIDERGDTVRITGKEGEEVEFKGGDDGSGTYTFTDEKGRTGSLEFSAGGEGEAKLPTGFPTDFPVLGGAKVISSFALADEEQSGYSATWTTEKSVTEATEFYSKALVEKGWRITTTAEISGSTSLVFERGPEDAEKKDTGWLSIGPAEGQTQVTLTLSLAK